MGVSDRQAKLLEGRGLDVELAERFGVTSSDRPGFDIRIPYVENGVEVNAKYRTLGGEKRFAQETGARKCFWNAAALTDPSLNDHPLLITEGELDALAAIQSGFARTISVPDGAPAEAVGENDTGAKYSYVREAKGALGDIREIILCTDNDGPGVNLLNDLSVRLGRARCKWVRYPRGCKDLNDALLTYGPKGVTETINRAQWMRVDGVFLMSELPPLPERRAYDIGMSQLGNHYKIRLGDLVVVTGIPSHGKTTFVNEVCCRMALASGWRVAFASFEQEPQTDHRRYLRTFFNRKKVAHQYPEDIDAADRWIDQQFSFIVPNEDDDVTLAWTLERCAAAILQYGAKIIVIDPWNEMDHIRPADMSLTEYTGFAIKQFRKLARKYQVHVIVVAHPTKQRKNEDGKIPIPTLYDISDSAHWYNKVEVGIIVHRQDESRTIIRIAKSKYHDQIGKPGEITGSFDIESGRYVIDEPMPSGASYHNAGGGR